MIEDMCKAARDNLEISQLPYKGNFDKKARTGTLNIGGHVLVMLPTEYNTLFMQ